MTRVEAIVRLLETRYDGLPEPVRRVEGMAGFVHDTVAWKVCPTCEGVDSDFCTGCGGRGEVSYTRSRDPYASQDVVKDYGFGLSRHDETRARDRAIDVLDRQLAGPRSEADLLAEANRHPYAWEIARDRMRKQFDYVALERAIEWLHDRFPGVWLQSPFALAYFDVVLPDPLRAPGLEPPLRVVGRVERAAGPRARGVRDDDVLSAIRAGEPTAAVAERVGLSVSQVNRIVRRAA